MGNFAENLNLGNHFRPPLYHTIIWYSATTIFDSDRGLQWEEFKENRDCEAVYTKPYF